MNWPLENFLLLPLLLFFEDLSRRSIMIISDKTMSKMKDITAMITIRMLEFEWEAPLSLWL